MSDAPAGYAKVFPGWNAWAVFQKDDLDFETLMVGVSPELRLRIWVEQQASKAPGVELADTVNLAALQGSQVEIIPSVDGLAVGQNRALELPAQEMFLDGPATRKLVRFYNRGSGEAFTPWPHDANYLLDAVFTPAPNNPITGGAPPSSLAGKLDKVSDTAGTVIKVVAVVAGLGLLALIIVKVANAKSVREAA